jgi:hypothetical protein
MIATVRANAHPILILSLNTRNISYFVVSLFPSILTVDLNAC